MQLIQINLCLLTVTALLFFSAPIFAQQSPNSQFLLSPNSSTVVLAYSEIPDMIANADTTPLIRVHADGLVLIHYPYYMKRAGEYEAYLNHDELEQLLIDIEGLIDFDSAKVKQATRKAKSSQFAATGLVSNSSDAVLKRFELNLDGYKATPSTRQRTIKQTVEWRDIQTDATTYPSVSDLGRLARAQNSIRSLLDRTDLNKLPKSSSLSNSVTLDW